MYKQVMKRKYNRVVEQLDAAKQFLYELAERIDKSADNIDIDELKEFILQGVRDAGRKET